MDVQNKLKIAVVACAIFLVSCEGNTPENAVRCDGSMAGHEVCAVDFMTLHVNDRYLQGKFVSLIGYIAVDQGVLVLYPSEVEYQNAINGSSLQLRASRDTQIETLNKFGYGYARITGRFDGGDVYAEKEGRLGTLVSPLVATPIIPRRSRQGAKDLRVDVRDLTGQVQKADN